MAACGLCGTDHEQYTGELAGGFAFVPGHETVGVLEAIGPRAAQRWGSGAPGFSPDVVVYKELRVIGALGVDATAYRAALELLASGRYPFENVPRRCVGLHDAGDLLATMGGEGDDVPPVHGVLTP